VTVDRTNDTAGAGSPAPAVSLSDVLAPEARIELDRIRRRWAELPIDRAEARMPLLRRLLTDLASLSPRLLAKNPLAEAHSGPVEVGASHEVEVPDLGPAAVVDQLAVLVWDAYANGHGDGIPQLLTGIRRELG
jgi:hypothetical protein